MRIDMENRFRLKEKEVEAVLPEQDLPKLTVAGMFRDTKPNVQIAV